MKMKADSSVFDTNERPFNWRCAVALTLHELRVAGMLKGTTVVLIGSYAHGVPTARSDVDILVLVPRRYDRRKITAPRSVHMQCQETETFRERAEQGDDYAISALRFGRILYDPTKRWTSLRDEFALSRWPDWREKMRYAARRVRFGDALLEAGDIDAAAEEYLLAATQIGRALLLRKHIYPLSRPQLGSQLKAADEGPLAESFETLMSKHLDSVKLRALSSRLHEMVLTSASS